MMYFFIPFSFVLYGIVFEGIQRRQRKTELFELNQLSDFLAEMIDEFYLCKNVTESLYRAAQNTQGKLREMLFDICFTLENEPSEHLVFDQKYPRHLRYIKLFFLQCVNAVSFGCGKRGEETSFVKNLTELRRDVLNESYKRTQAGFLFSGLTYISLFPALFLPLIRMWGMKNMPELALFYEGTAGRLCVFVFFILLFLCYAGLLMVKQVDEIFYVRGKLLRSFFQLRFLKQIGRMFRETKPERIGREQLKKIGLFQNGMEYWCGCFFGGLFCSFAVFIISVSEPVWKRTLSATIAYLIGFSMMMLCYWYLSYLRKLGMSGETLSMQSVILLLFEAPNMTIGKMLETLEDYAVIFKRSLSRCVDFYASEEREALVSLCQAEEYAPFRQLANRLVISERLGLQRAFSELSADRYFFREQQRLDTEQEIKKKAANAQILAFIPLFFLLFAYLIFPFLLSSLSKMAEVFAEMNQMRMS